MLDELGEVSFGMLKLGELGEPSFGKYKLGELDIPGPVLYIYIYKFDSKIGDLQKIKVIVLKIQLVIAMDKNKKGPVGQTAQQYSESTTIHGIAYIFESSVTALERLSLWRD